ncbi:mitochondrial ribosomal protein S15 [Russula earlei]|uniref:Mitochondrial ribosomal protein S15 n=1 Tax=Russula earlei TaxID=71964 RepID=A0ACC0UHL7_9AGAM|nr:mitochondrial ribosomal protein S15 [Russula earlei]
MKMFHGKVDMPCPREPSTRHFLAWVPLEITETRETSRAAATFASSSSTFAPFHTSAVVSASAKSARKRQAQLRKAAAAARPHVVLGTVAGDDDAKWANCDLARALVRPEELEQRQQQQQEEEEEDAPAQGVSSPSPSPSETGPGSLPLAFGIRERERRMLFEHLPLLSADMSTRREMNAMGRGSGTAGGNVEEMAAHHEAETAAGVAQASVLAKLVDLRNANAAGIAFENRRRVVEAFSEPGKPDDTGRTEVQAALLTLQIRNLWKHLSQFKRDVANRRSLRRLVHQRAKLLKYLKRADRDRYERVLERLGLEPGAIESELVV